MCATSFGNRRHTLLPIQYAQKRGRQPQPPSDVVSCWQHARQRALLRSESLTALVDDAVVGKSSSPKQPEEPARESESRPCCSCKCTIWNRFMSEGAGGHNHPPLHEVMCASEHGMSESSWRIHVWTRPAAREQRVRRPAFRMAWRPLPGGKWMELIEPNTAAYLRLYVMCVRARTAN